MTKKLKFIHSLSISLVLSIASIIAVTFFYHGKLDFSKVSFFSIAIATLVAISSLYFEAERVRLIGRTMARKVPFKAALESVLGKEFLSALTPFGSGGQPLSIYILSRYNFKIGAAITISYLETFYTMLILFISGILGLFFYNNLLESKTLIVFIIWGFTAMILFFLFSYMSIAKPKRLKKISFLVVNTLMRMRILKPHKLFLIKKRVINEIILFNKHIKNSFKAHWFLILSLFLMTALFWGLRFFSLFPIVLSMGLPIAAGELIMISMIITSLNYFSFTPGASGTTIALAASLFHQIFTAANGNVFADLTTPTFTTLWRFFSFYLITFVCGIVIFRVIMLFSSSKIQKKVENKERELEG